MSFYGKIKRVQSSPFVFDKYYPNRMAMEEGASTDGVYIGRYVLVKYTCEYIDGKAQYFDKYEPVPDNPEQKQVSAKYEANVNIDKDYYHDTFDGTVWQKIYTGITDTNNNAIEKYIMVAELKAAIPRLTIKEPHLAPKYFDENNNEYWRNIEINEENCSEEAYQINIPEIIHLEVGDNSNLFDQRLLNPAVQTVIKPEPVDSPNASMFDENNNYMRWTSYYQNKIATDPSNTEKNIDEKRLESKLNGLGQAISDLYDVLYGKPAGNNGGSRPFFTEDLSEVLSQYDKGLVGILSSIATDIKGDPSQDYAGRTYQPGMYYYFVSKWGDAIEDPDNFIENIPRVIGSADDYTAGKSHYYINYTNWELSSSAQT